MLGARLTSAGQVPASAQSGRSSGVEHNLAKVGVEGSNPFARSNAGMPGHAKPLERTSVARGDSFPQHGEGAISGRWIYRP
jgi:hypothetical protein